MPYLPAVRLAFDPAEHIAIDESPKGLERIPENYPNIPAEGRGSVRAIVADATDPRSIHGYDANKQVDMVLAIHPDISMAGKGDEGYDNDFKADPTMLEQLRNWHGQLKPGGKTFFVTYFTEEAQAILDDKELGPFVELAGVTAPLKEDDYRPIAYLVVLGQEQRPEGMEPIVWNREDYHAYNPDREDDYNPNISLPEAQS